MANSSYRNLSDALAFVLGELGAAVLDDPKRFNAALSDVADQQSREMRVLRHHGNDRMLGFYVAALGGNAEALRGAAGRAEQYLVDDCVVDAATAHEVAWQLAQGVASWRGLSLPQEQKKPEGKKPKPKTATNKTTTTELPKTKPATRKAPAGAAATAGPAQQQGAGQGQKGAGGSSGAAAAANQGQQQTTTTSTPANQAGSPGATKTSGLSGGGIAALVVAGLLAFFAWRMFGWRMGLETEAYVTNHVQTTLANGYMSSYADYRHDLYGNQTSSTSWFQTEDGDTFDETDSYEGYDDYGYPSTHAHSYTVTEPGGKVSSRSETTEEFEYHYDPSGRLHSKVVTTTERYQHGDGEWGEPETSKELVIYRYANDLPFGLARLWTIKEDSSFDEVTVIEYDKHLRSVSYTSDMTFSDGDTSHYESITSYSYSGDNLTSSRNTSSYTSGSYSSNSQTDTTYDNEGNAKHETTKEDGQVTAEYEFEHDSNDSRTERTNVLDGSVTVWESTRVPRGSIAVRTGIR